MRLVAAQERAHLVAAVQRRTHLVAVVDGFGSEVSTSEVRFLLDAFLPGLYFLPLIVRWSFFSATAKTLATCNCVHLELKSSFLIKSVQSQPSIWWDL